MDDKAFPGIIEFALPTKTINILTESIEEARIKFVLFIT